ncbi:TPA: motility associated factor glycosyltransferase family protein [Campylobacter lari]|uniref:motility associated factor glycosyltransferase family protein n=1 Tax=Campylobacter lari TaxID=201 RepID=UPI001417A566|nr:motility associated factor glycosyltransferase family protein [Campylobacter lari]EAI8646630.1 motility associated factor glycosyltransferase family protein [Campylobacter lari]EAJ5686464.1 motility associated factor glycosyltransferase family protein [Campylobacter lari]EAK3646877.1 motility associated factor glycosyltransferase family protein [Campylobacter lari]ECP5280265.1 motility associated factor glycosyltransferase family protein [Campylobacter lari]EGK8020819.1 motility associated 
MNKTLNLYNDKYLLYPALFFYGFGNGILYKALLQNPNHKIILVFEPDINIIYTMFNILDFSKELKEKRLIIKYTKFLCKEDFLKICSNKNVFNFLRTYFLEIHSSYYEKYHDDILQLNSSMQNAIKENIFSYGNSPIDYLEGIQHFIYNIPNMITHPTYKELLNKRKNLSDNAIIVSTGPSLTKQLPLLKQYQNKASIFCADSAYPILAKEGIKPDYVLSLERTEKTSEFFNNDFGEFDKDILFAVKSVVHKNTISYLEKKEKYDSNYIIISNPSTFMQNVKLDHFGYFGMGNSVAHMAYSLAVDFGCKNIILIGQDLAYNDLGESHPKNYLNSATYESDMYEHMEVLAYRGKGLVKTHCIWLWFKSTLENLIKSNSHIITYNCTEGGARINGAIEKTFKYVCEKLLDKSLNKPFVKLSNLSMHKQDEMLLKAYYKVYKNIQECQNIIYYFQKINENLLDDFNMVHLKNHENSKDLLEQIIHKIDCAKIEIEKLLKNSLCEILIPSIRQFELNLARIYVLNPKTQEDSYNKSLLWIKEHLYWIKLVISHIDNQKKVLQENIIPTKRELEKRRLSKFVKKIEEKNYFNL